MKWKPLGTFELWCWRRLLREEIKPAKPKGNQPWIFIGETDWNWNWCWNQSTNSLATWCEEPTNWNRIRLSDWITTITRPLQFVCVSSVQFSSVAKSCPSLCNPMNRSMPGLPVHHQLPESTQTHVHRVNDVIQPSHPLSSPSLPTLNLSQHQGFFQWVSSSHQVAKVLEFQLQHQSFQWTPRTDLL